MSARRGNWMQTFTGVCYWPIDPRVEDVNIEDIAHHLSLLCRFTGACVDFYSVAEHSVHASNLVAPEYAFQALMHDAPEAYVNDIARPVKPYLENYDAIEAANWDVIRLKFGLPPELHPSVKEIDSRLCRTEKEQNMRPTEHDGSWSHLGEPLDLCIGCWSPDKAETRFLNRFYELYKGGA